ncbi:MAG: exodeoxyribonuclease VII large subunit [Pseudomonadota bacterium]
MNIELSAAGKGMVLSVGELNLAVRQLLERNAPLLWVRGEISNFVRAASGHWYFSLKDAQAQVRCVMFRHKSQHLDWQPKNGMQVEVLALATLYEPRGDFQLTLEQMRPAGVGNLYEAFELLKRKLESEGLFDSVRKRILPTFPHRIGVITSPQAAALRDVLTTLARRMPSIPVLLYPTPVQGEGAGQKIAQAIRVAGERAECDVLIVCRGGGSIEDLWAFNEEIVARAIAECPIPVVSGVGHETDFTIADFAADWRAATPTAAAQAVTPDRNALLQKLQHSAQHLSRLIERRFERDGQLLDCLQRRMIHPSQRANQQLQTLAHVQQRLEQSWREAVRQSNWRLLGLQQRLTAVRIQPAKQVAGLQQLAQRLRRAYAASNALHEAHLDGLRQHLLHLDPQQVLARGYSVVRDAQGAIVVDSAGLQPGNRLDITFARGWARTELKETGGAS